MLKHIKTHNRINPLFLKKQSCGHGLTWVANPDHTDWDDNISNHGSSCSSCFSQALPTRPVPTRYRIIYTFLLPFPLLFHVNYNVDNIVHNLWVCLNLWIIIFIICGQYCPHIGDIRLRYTFWSNIKIWISSLFYLNLKSWTSIFHFPIFYFVLFIFIGSVI